MSSRRDRSRNRNDQQDVFNTNPNNSNLEEFARMMYRTPDAEEELRRLESKPTRIKRLPLDKVIPDPTQARRVMPHELRLAWITKPDSVVQVLNNWLTRANNEAELLGRDPINVEALLSRSLDEKFTEQLQENAQEEEIGPVEADFRALIQLAASIRLHGLANPVTVVTLPNGMYQLETGERRLLAFNLLHMLPQFVEEQEFDTIPARIVDEKDLWRQAAENGARQDLNAISIARQLALLLMDLYKDKADFSTWSPQLDVEWYSQVRDSSKFPVPYGRGSEIAAALGLKSANQIRQYRALLGLPRAVWTLADEGDWSEYKIRLMMKDARNLGRKLSKHEHEVLEMLAQHQAGILPVLPANFGEEKPRDMPLKVKSEVVFWNQIATLINVDIEAGTVTFQLVEPEVLGRLHGTKNETDYLSLTVKKAN